MTLHYSIKMDFLTTPPLLPVFLYWKLMSHCCVPEQGTLSNGVYNSFTYLIRVYDRVWWIFDMKKCIQLVKAIRLIVHNTPWISTIGGGSYSKKLFELFLVDSDRTRRDKHAYIGHSSGWAKFFELGVFEFWEFWPENVTFFN